MAFNNGYAAYQNTNIKTASQGKLVILLYENAVKNLSAAELLIDSEDKIQPKNMEKFGKFVQKAQAIITELQVSLDMEKGGEISKNLMSLYIFFNQELLDASIKHEKSKIIYVKNQLNELLGAWREAAKTTSNVSAPQTQTLNIQG